MINLPDWLYKILPYFYLCAGVLTLVVLRNELGIFSGVTLISAGAIVWLLRGRSRRESASIEEKAPAGGLVQISWNQSFECGHPIIDAQHRRLFGIANELIDAVLTKKPVQDVELLLDELVEHITGHFATEEGLLAKTGHPVSAEHQEIHRFLLAKAADLRDRHRTGQIIIGELVGFITYDVVTEHIINDDRKFAEAVKTA